jgi:hypothetical protein
MHVFACILSVFCIKCMHIRICIERLLHVTVRCAQARGSCTFAALSLLGQLHRAGSAGAGE